MNLTVVALFFYLFGLVLASVSTNKNRKIHLISVDSADILQDGSYASHFVSLSTKIVKEYFSEKVETMSEATPTSISVLSESFELLKASTFGIDIKTIQNPIVQNLLTEYTKESIQLTISNCEDLEILKRTAHAIKFLVYECFTLNVVIPSKQALKLFNFIYEFAEDGFRFQSSIVKLHLSLSSEQVSVFFETFPAIFNPFGPILPILDTSKIGNTPEIREKIDRFFRSIHEKVSLFVDPVENNALYCAHMNTLISCLLVNSNTDNFIDIFANVLPRIDPVSLLKSRNFYEYFIQFISNNNTSPVLTYFINCFINDMTITKIPEDFYIKFGSILNKLTVDVTETSTMVNQQISSLSIGSKTKIKEIKKVYNKYDMMFIRFKALEFIYIGFKTLTLGALRNLQRDLIELVDYAGVLLEFNPKITEMNSANSLSVLVEICSKEPIDSKFNFDRLSYFVLFLNLLAKLKVSKDLIVSNFLRVLQFYNTHINTSNHKKLENIVNSFKVFLKAHLSGNSGVLKTVEDYKIVFDFFKKTDGESSATAELTQILKNYLKTSTSRETIQLFIDIEKELEIPASQILLESLFKQLAALKTANRVQVSGKLWTFFEDLESFGLLSRTEYLIIQAYKQAI